MPEFIYRDEETFAGPPVANFTGSFTLTDISALLTFLYNAHRQLVASQYKAEAEGYGEKFEHRLYVRGSGDTDATLVVTARRDISPQSSTAANGEVHDYQDPDVRDMPGGSAVVVHRTGVSTDAVSTPAETCKICAEDEKKFRGDIYTMPDGIQATLTGPQDAGQ